MKTRLGIFLEDVVDMGEDVMLNNLLIPPRDMERGHYVTTIAIDTAIGGLVGGPIGAIIGVSYGAFCPLACSGIRELRDGFRDYMNSLEKRVRKSELPNCN